MKHTYIAGVIVLLLVGVWYTTSREEAKAPAVIEEADKVVEDITTATEENGPSAESESATNPESSATPEVVDESTPVVETEDVTAVDPEPAPEAHVFTVTGVNFAFNLEEITVKEGDTVTINFESESGFHDWVVDEFDAATQQVRPDTPTSVTFVADKKGTYEYYCSVGSHRANGMVGNLIVE